MKKSFLIACLILAVSVTASYAGFLDFLKGIKVPAVERTDDETIISGLKEALTIGTGNAVRNVSAVDGYFGNMDIKILMPEKIRAVADVLARVGYQKQVDDFVASMNRAAEKAAPMATDYFVGAIKEMTFDDARNISTEAIRLQPTISRQRRTTRFTLRLSP
jgi:hypothetical protein